MASTIVLSCVLSRLSSQIISLTRPTTVRLPIGTRQRHMDAERILEIHCKLQCHQRVEPDFAERTDATDLIFPRMQDARESCHDDVGQFTSDAVEALGLRQWRVDRR